MKWYFSIIALVAGIVLISWTFNHINPWVAIILALIAIGFIINYLIKKAK